MIDLLAIWLLLFGVWPLADPGHWPLTPLTIIDLAAHLAGASEIVSRWALVRRTGPPSSSSGET